MGGISTMTGDRERERELLLMMFFSGAPSSRSLTTSTWLDSNSPIYERTDHQFWSGMTANGNDYSQCKF